MVAEDGLNTWIIPLTEKSDERLEISVRGIKGLDGSSFTGRKTIPDGLLFTCKNGDYGAIFVTEQSCAVPVLKTWIVAYRIGFCATLCGSVNRYLNRSGSE